MTHLKTYLAVATLAFTGCQSANNAGETAELWYAQPAKEWKQLSICPTERLLQ